MLSLANPYLIKITEAHERSGLSYREVAQACDLDPSYVHYILKGAHRPHRDVLIALSFAYRLDRWEMDEILLLAGVPPIGRSAHCEQGNTFARGRVLKVYNGKLCL